jgi:hypothetical protein
MLLAEEEGDEEITYTATTVRFFFFKYFGFSKGKEGEGGEGERRREKERSREKEREDLVFLNLERFCQETFLFLGKFFEMGGFFFLFFSIFLNFLVGKESYRGKKRRETRGPRTGDTEGGGRERAGTKETKEERLVGQGGPRE